ncbi:MAG TPA: 3-oxoacyl-ACP reductase family protein [Dehalococcoidia bacterium]|nr:3-oxoacyl-ACP reductase family protein [Dehalococcoidia bacterium]
MAARLDGRVAIVTGASRGIGRAVALELANVGAKVVVNYAQAKDMAEGLVEEIKKGGGEAIAIQADVSKFEECKKLVDQSLAAYGQVDILINNAGINRDRTIQRMSPEEWHAVIETDLSSAFYMTNLLAGHMRERNFGRIVNMSSIIGQSGNIGQANYAAAKAGLIAFSKSAALELARFNITVNAMCPGFVETDMVTALNDDIKAALLAKIPLGRFGRPEEVATFVRYIVTEGDWITGQQLNPNGGQYM